MCVVHWLDGISLIFLTGCAVSKAAVVGVCRAEEEPAEDDAVKRRVLKTRNGCSGIMKRRMLRRRIKITTNAGDRLGGCFAYITGDGLEGSFLALFSSLEGLFWLLGTYIISVLFTVLRFCLLVQLVI